MFSLLLLALPAVLALPSRSSLAHQLYARQDNSCPANVQPSCSSGRNVDTCCVNAPGGYLLQTQFWDASPATGPSDSFTIHGLWPDLCGGGFKGSCDRSRAYTGIGDILANAGAQSTLDYMNTYWKNGNGGDESFWEHEWAKHGTCVSTLEPKCYGPNYVYQQEVVDFFNLTVSLFQTLPTYSWLTASGITPDYSATYTLQQLQDVAIANFGQEAVWDCQNGALNQVWYGFTTVGPADLGNFVPAAPVGSSTCPDSGIQWIPKDNSGNGGN